MPNRCHPRAGASAAVCRRAIVVTGVLLGAGCTVGPDYHAQESAAPGSWMGAAAPGESPEPAAGRSVPTSDAPDIKRWWDGMNEPMLSSLVAQAVSGNLDLVQAEARIRQARAGVTISGADHWPSVAAVGSATRTRSGNSDSAHTGNFFQAGFDAAWELDIFGGVRRSVEVSEATLEFAVEDRRDVMVSLAAEVGVNYVNLRGTQQQLGIARENLEAQRQSVKITTQRYNGGFVSRLDVANAEAQVADTLARIPALEALARQQVYSLGVLVGREPGALVDELSAEAPMPPIPPKVPVGLPSEIVRRRPDIRRAEANLHAATARIGVATADLFPKFSITGSLGLQGSSVSALSTMGDRFWSIGPSVTWPIFTAGKIQANIDLQRAMTDESYAAYQKTVLTALQEVETALVIYTKEQERRDALADSVAANREAVDLSTQLYSAGRTDFLNVLNAQRGLFDAENTLSLSEQVLVVDLITLYKALGGGWEEGANGEDGTRTGPGAAPEQQ